MLDLFLNRQLPLANAPYPPLCGAVPLPPGSVLPLATFVAANLGEGWTLCYIVEEIKGGYMICDAESEDSEAPVSVRSDLVLPLPVTLPAEKKSKACEFAAGAKVLALWPENGVWTSVFYRAIVLKSPSENGGVYRLDFEGCTKPTNVPAGFVIAPAAQTAPPVEDL
jgi:hypothetical protein